MKKEHFEKMYKQIYVLRQAFFSNLLSLMPYSHETFFTQYCDIAIKRYFDFSQLISIEQPR